MKITHLTRAVQLLRLRRAHQSTIHPPQSPLEEPKAPGSTNKFSNLSCKKPFNTTKQTALSYPSPPLRKKASRLFPLIRFTQREGRKSSMRTMAVKHSVWDYLSSVLCYPREMNHSTCHIGVWVHAARCFLNICCNK